MYITVEYVYRSLATTIPNNWSSRPSTVNAKFITVTLLNISGK